MIDRILIDSLNLKARDFAIRWKNLIRNTRQLKHYQTKDDETLIETIRHCFPLLSRTLDRGFDQSKICSFFSTMGKERMEDGFPVSEVIYGLNVAQKVVIEYQITEAAHDNPMRMYQSMGTLTRIAEFFLLGSFYMSKGFLEEIHKSMDSNCKISEEFLQKYFKDDFFFNG